MNNELEQRLQEALQTWGDERYREGLNKGIQSLEKVRGWLTRQPDRKWQKEVREWVDKLLNGLSGI